MSSELDTIYDEISRWSVENIESIMYHMEWTRDRGKNPFRHLGIKPAKPPLSFTNNRNELKALLDQDFEGFTPEQKAKIIISSTFLLMNDKIKLRHENLYELINQNEIKTNLLQLLEAMERHKDCSASGKKITKLQLFYAFCKQRENPKFKIKKVTWANVTSKWGPKIVMSDGESYYYIFNQIDDFATFHENYNIAATLGRTEHYKSKYLEEKNDFNLNILKVNATNKCTTLAEYFKNKNMGSEKNESNTKLFERLSEEFFRNGLEIGLPATSDELSKILPRLTQEENRDPCVSSILRNDKEWVVARTKVKADDQEYFVVHGDEWGGNFLVTESARRVFMIDFEDAIFANANELETVICVGGDLSSRIFSPRKNVDQKFLPIGLSVFASIGRLLAAIVQYHARHHELESKNIGTIIGNYLTSFENSLEETNSILKGDYWTDLQQLILLHAWDWALYWQQKKNHVFPTKHYGKFIEEIKKLLGCHEESIGMAQENEDPPSPRKSVYEYPDDGNQDARIMFEKAKEFSNEEKYDEALSALLKAHSLVGEKGNQTEKAFLSLWIGITSILADEEKEYAISWFKQTEQTLVNNGSELTPRDENILLENYEQMIWLYNSNDDYTSAEVILQKWFEQYYFCNENYSGELTLDWILRKPSNVNIGDFEFHFTGIWTRAAWLYNGKGEYLTAAKIFEGLAKNETNDDTADNWKMCEAIAYSKAGDYDKAELIELGCLQFRKRMLMKNANQDGRLVSAALRNLGQNAKAAKEDKKAREYFGKCLQAIGDIDHKWVSAEEKEEWKTTINEMMSGLLKANIPKLSESQYNIFSGSMFNYISPYKGEITDKVFEVQLKKLNRIEDPQFRVGYIKENIIPECRNNRELKYFSLLYIILNSDYREAKNHYDRVERLAGKLAVESGDDEYRYTSQLVLFSTSYLDQDPGKFYDDMINIPHGPQIPSTFFVCSRFFLSNYHMSKGEYPIALEFNIEGGELLPEIPETEEVALWWSLYNTRCILFVHTDNTEKLNRIIINLVVIFEVLVLELEENTLFCNSNQFYTLLRELNDYDTQERILEYFNKPEFKDELEEENLAQLHLWNGQKFLIEKKFGKSIQSFELAASYATNQKMKSNALCNLGSSHYNLGQFKEAISCIEQGMKLDESELEYWRIYDMFAFCCIKIEDYRKALQYLKKCAKVNHKLYLSNSLAEHFYYFLKCSKEELMLGFDQFKGLYHAATVYSEFGQLLKKGIREFKKTSYKNDSCESILIELREICKICSGIDPQFYSDQLSRIERLWIKKQNSFVFD